MRCKACGFDNLKTDKEFKLVSIKAYNAYNFVSGDNVVQLYVCPECKTIRAD